MLVQIIAGIVLFVIMLIVGLRMSHATAPDIEDIGVSCGSGCACCSGSCSNVNSTSDIEDSEFD